MPYRRSMRLKGYDYAAIGMYFFTVCTHNRECLFGEIENGEMILNDAGGMVKFTWFDLTNHSVNVSLDCFIIMPNHVHGIIVITNNKYVVGAGSKPALIQPDPAPIQPKSTSTEWAGLEPGGIIIRNCASI